MKKIYVVLVGIFVFGFMALIAIYFPATALPTNSDFSAIYNTDVALVNRIPIYDLVAVREFVQPLSKVPDENFFLARFPYPAWYALSTFYLGLLPASSAATLWFEINLLILFLSVWFLTDGWNGRLRLISFPFALLFLPVLGALSIGQYDFPVLLGTSLILFGLKKENILSVVIGTMLITFKPHIGGLIFIFLLIWLFFKQNEFGKRSIKYVFFSLFTLCLLGFLADLNWIRGYLNMLLNYQNEGNVTSCSECISVPMLISRWLFDGSLRTAIFIGLTLLILFSILYFFKRDLFLKSSTVFITTALITTLWISPYFYNYDFILLLIPFAFLIENRINKFTGIVVILCFLIPYFAIGMYGRAGNISLILITLLITIIFYSQIRALTTRPQAHTMQTTK